MELGKNYVTRGHTRKGKGRLENMCWDRTGVTRRLGEWCVKGAKWSKNRSRAMTKGMQGE